MTDFRTLCGANFYYLKKKSHMHFKTPIQVYIKQDVLSTTVRTRNDYKISRKILTPTGFEPVGVSILS